MPPPKRRERDSTSNSNGIPTSSNAVDSTKLIAHQQEQDLFLQAFEKPTQIYRFLHSRHGTSPIFLNRTLSYMKDRMSRNHKRRVSFKVNSLLDTVTKSPEIESNNFLNIIYKGVFDKNGTCDQLLKAEQLVCVECTLYKITKNKRKDSTSELQEISRQSTNVFFNPEDEIEYSTASVPVKLMHPLSDHTIYKLIFRIKSSPKGFKGYENGENEETPNKRCKMSTETFGCELVIFEKNMLYIPEGDYESVLQDIQIVNNKSYSPKKRVWETLPEHYRLVKQEFDAFKKLPSIKFRLTWSSTEIPAFLKQQEYLDIARFSQVVQNGSNGDINHESKNGALNDMKVNHNNNCIKTEKIQIVYNFLYSNNTRQQTEYTQEVICPWCSIDCLRLSPLLNHLKFCHARFNFTYQPVTNGAQIDVTINDSYDGSYAGSPHDLAGPSGCSFARTCGPVRRASVTNLLVYRPRRQKTSLDDFLVLDEDDLSNQRAYITGHNRLYHHTETCLPVHRKELDIDSEAECDPLWLRQKTIQMIDEFSDVNEGEKELMKLWNLHVMKHGYVGDCQLPLACEMFLDTNGDDIIRKNLFRNFILHLSSLFDYGLISPETLYKTVQKLQGKLSKYTEGQVMMSKQREVQLQYWREVGVFKQDEQKLKSTYKQTLAENNKQLETKNETSASGEATLINKQMHPPVKRSAKNVRRSNVHVQNGLIVPDILANNSTKNVAKKSVQHDDEEYPTSGRERRQTESIKRNSMNDYNLMNKIKIDNNSLNQSGKRRLSNKDANQSPVKRNRIDNITHQPTGNKSNSIQRTSTKQIGKRNMPLASSLASKIPLPDAIQKRRQTISAPCANNACTSKSSPLLIKNDKINECRRMRIIFLKVISKFFALSMKFLKANIS